MIYKVILAKEAVKSLDRVDRGLESRLQKSLRKLENEPEKQGKALKGIEDLYPMRVDAWRILYTINIDSSVVYVLAIKPRGQVYK